MRTAKTFYLIRLIFYSLVFSQQCFADNQGLYNAAYDQGKTHQMNMQLNPNSTLSSFGVANHFESSVAQTATAGNTNAKAMASHIYSDNSDPNYLYTRGSQSIADCLNKTDPRCSTLNKYGDKDTQAGFQAYSHGVSTRYSIAISPDPTHGNCSIVTRKLPINQTLHECVANAKISNKCFNSIVPYQVVHPATPVDGTLFAPTGSPGVCGVGAVTGVWIPQSDRAWFAIGMSEGYFAGGQLPLSFGATSQNTPCRSVSGVIQTNPTSSWILIGQFYMDWLVGTKGNIGLYQAPGVNCGDVNSLTCTINLSLIEIGKNTLANWQVSFPHPKLQIRQTVYQYNQGCHNGN